MRRNRGQTLHLFWNGVKVVILLLLAGVSGVLIASVYSITRVLPSKAEIEAFHPSEATLIYSADGALLAQVYDENREYVPLTEIPKHMLDATVAIEDARFYTHSGVDPKGIVRAVFENLRGGRVMQGGSTLTQQLARNIYLTQRRTVSRKLQEMLLARKIERLLTKQEILERYLNVVNYGSGAYGVKAAARTYFDKLPSQLTLAECAMLAGLPKRPSGLSPYKSLGPAITRRNTVLSRMAELGYISDAEARRAKAEKPHLASPQLVHLRTKRAPHFVDYVVKQLVAKYGPDAVFRGGLRVETTLNLQVQETAEHAIRKQVMLARAQGKRIEQGAVVSVEPLTGYIKVMVGSLNYSDPRGGQYNRTAQGRGRQPGSAFKAFVYTAAIDRGFGPDYMLSDTRIAFRDYRRVWRPRNFDGKYRGAVTIREAIAKSINIPAIRMTSILGVDKVIAYAHRLGIKSPLTRNLSIAIGTSEVTPLELAAAYCTFPAGGMYAEPVAITQVKDRNGKILEQYRPHPVRVIPAETAATMVELFRNVVMNGTGKRANSIAGACGKTGTTQDLRDAWFLGFTKDLATAVWIGNDDYTPMGYAVFGGTVCAPAWVEIMQTAVPVFARARQESGNTVVARAETAKPRPTTEAERQRLRNEIEQDTYFCVVCRVTGLLATDWCPERVKIGFLRGTEPKQRCFLHGPQSQRKTSNIGGTRSEGTAASERMVEVSICVQSQRLANEYCPEVESRKLPEEQIPSVCTLHGPTTEKNDTP